MKKLFLHFALLLNFTLLAGNTTALTSQVKIDVPPPSLIEICQTLNKAAIFVQYRDFREKFQKMNSEIAPKLSYNEHERLHLAYNNVERRYNDFLTLVKADLSDAKTIKSMVRDPQRFAESYADDYKKVVDTYNSEYMPIYNDVKSRTRGFNPVLLASSIELFNKVVDWIKQRQELREEQLNTILGIVNKYFYDELRMKSWSELGLKPAPNAPENATPASTAADANNTAGGRRNSTTSTSSGATTTTKNVPGDVLNPHSVPAATFKELQGSVEFIFLKDDVTPTPMRFKTGATRDISVGYLKALPKDTKGDVIIASSNVKTMTYYSTDVFDENAHFQLKVNNSAGVYILALNKDGKAADFLYPFDNKDLPECSAAKKTQMRDIGVSSLKASPVVGKDIDGNITLPSADCSTTPPTERYYTISGNAKEETFCVLLSKSELNMTDLKERIEAEQGPLAERLSHIFANQAIAPNDANLILTENKLAFDARTAQNNVLPLVFLIKRK